jgi:hypothetical protein
VIFKEMYFLPTQKYYIENFTYYLEVKKMNQLKGFPFEPLGDPNVTPCGGGGPGGGGFPG